MIEALKPCPACGHNKPYAHMRVQWGDKPSIHDNRRWAVFCGDAGGGKWKKDTCRFLVDACETEEEAIAAWNRQASPSWSTEPPTEEGWYLMRWQDLEDDEFFGQIVIEVEKSLDEFFALSHVFVDGNYDIYERFNCYGNCETSIENILESGCEIHWLKIDVPAPPEESEVTP